MDAPLNVRLRRWLRWPLVHWGGRRPPSLGFDAAAETDLGFLADDSRHFEVFAAWLYGFWSAPRGETMDDRRDSLRCHLNLDALPLAIVAYRNGEPAGIVSLRAEDLRSRAEVGPWLSALYVDSAHRGHGVGRALVAAAEDVAAWLGYDRLFLFTATVPDFYAGLGWNRLPPTLAEASQTTPPVVFWRRLA